MDRPLTRSPFLGDIEPVDVSDEELRAALEEAELPPLLPALAYLTGDLTLLREDLRPNPVLLSLPQAGLTAEQASEIRRLALAALIRYRDGGCRPAPPPSDETVLQIMEFAVGGADMQQYLPLLEEELAHRGEDRRAPTWHVADLAPDRSFTVAVIGAGLSGLAAAHRLSQAGLDVVVLEKDDDVGGTWHENRYPGCRVDIPNHDYSFSFAQRHDWPLHYSTQPVLQQYARDCADAFGLRDRIRFGTEVISARWSDDELRWTVATRDAAGRDETFVVDAVVSAVGQLNQPNLPSIPGLETFEGPAFHSARWDHSVDLAGKRVAVIGTGASAVQFVPEIAPVVDELLVFQRTPPWIGPTPNYHDAVPDGLRWLYRHVPGYAEWHRFCIFWQLGDGSLAAVAVDPDWEGGGESVSALNDLMRQAMLGNIQQALDGRPDLLEACTPHYPPGAKRALRDNGAWFAALRRENVRLLDGGAIRSITPSGIVTGDGVEEPVDVIVYGTGFTASRFLTPMTVTGRGGLDLHEHWDGDARAYLGVTIPGFPNLFCLYGPNTNIVINGSIIYFSECGVRYILGLLGELLGRGDRALDVRREVHDAFNEAVDRENDRMAWGASHVNSWYRNEKGRISQNWPFTLLDYWQRTAAPDPTDYEWL